MGNHLEIAVSLTGLAFLMNGIVLLVIPELSLESDRTNLKMLPLVGADFLVAGFYLGWASYFTYG